MNKDNQFTWFRLYAVIALVYLSVMQASIVRQQFADQKAIAEIQRLIEENGKLMKERFSP